MNTFRNNGIVYKMIFQQYSQLNYGKHLFQIYILNKYLYIISIYIVIKLNIYIFNNRSIHKEYN